MRSLPAPQALWKALLVLLLLFSALPTPAQAQAKTQTKAKAKPKAKPKTKAPEKAPAQEQQKPAEQQKSQEATKAPEPAPAPEKAPPEKKPQAEEKASAPAKAQKPAKAQPPPKVQPPPKAPALQAQSQIQAQERAEASAKMRIGVGLDLFTEKAKMTGDQAINASRRDESFNYNSATFLSATLSMSVPAPIAQDRARIGGGVRLFGNYSAGGDRQFGFGLFNQAFVTGEYGLPVADKMEAVFGSRLGVSLLIPGREFVQEIDRLQDQGVGVWSVPRVGWLVGLNVGARRTMSEHILLRADLGAQLEKLFLFSTSEEIEGLQFDKHWSTLGLRLGLTLGVEFAL